MFNSTCMCMLHVCVMICHLKKDVEWIFIKTLIFYVCEYLESWYDFFQFEKR